MLLLLDGHSSHFSLEAFKFASENEIILFCLPPCITHVAQPLDDSFLLTVKGTGLECAMSMQLIILGGQLQSFSSFHSSARLDFYPYSLLQLRMSGYRKVGVYPFNPTAI